MERERVYARIETKILETIDQLAAGQGSTRSETVNFLLRRAIEDGYSRGLQFTLLNELRTKHAGEKFSPMELEKLGNEIQARMGFNALLTIGLLNERR